MAKPKFPGLVLVPPSDRSLLKRRLAKWAFLIISVIGGLSSLNIWLPSSDPGRECQPGAGAESTAPLRQDCTQNAQTTVVTPSPAQPELLASKRTTPEVPKRVVPVQSRTSRPVAVAPPTKPPVEQPPAQLEVAQVTPTPQDNSVSATSNRMVASSQVDEAAASATDPEPVANHTPSQTHPDLVLAEQGDAFAQYRLGRFYAQQSGLFSPESVSWYTKASDGLRRLASAGNGKAMYVLGVMYAFGRGVVQNKEEARSWLEQAVAHQVPAAGPVLASLDKNRPGDSNPSMIVQTKRRQT